MSCFNTYSLHAISFSQMLFSLLKHYLDTDTALKVSQSVYCFTAFISHGVENYFPRLWGTGISDSIFSSLEPSKKLLYIFSCNDCIRCVIRVDY